MNPAVIQPYGLAEGNPPPPEWAKVVPLIFALGL
jgi:hypothetical protein